MTERDDRLERGIALLRDPVTLDPNLDRRVAARVATLPLPRPAGPLRVAARWFVQRRQLAVRPVWALAAAGALVLATLGIRAALTPGAPAPAMAPGTQEVRFVVLAPGASAVAVVGDFNDWAGNATPMARIGTSDLWAATVAMKPGRYRYAFVADGTIWLVDPDAPRALDDDFGRPNSVVTIGGPT